MASLGTPDLTSLLPSNASGEASSSKTVIYAPLAGNLAIALTKLAAAVITGSSAMFSEAVYSAVDTGNELLLLHGYRRSARQPDAIHPFGYGRELYFWSFIVALLLFGLGAGVSLYQGVRHVIHRRPVDQPLVSYLDLALSFLFEGASWRVAWRAFAKAGGRLGFWAAFRQSKDPPTFMVLFEDSAALIGIVIAATGILAADLLAMPLFDGDASILIGLVLAITALLLAVESKSLLVGERASPALVAAVRRIAQGQSGVIGANSVLTAQLAPHQAIVGLSIEFDPRLTAPEIEDCVAAIEARVSAQHPDVSALFVKPQSAGDFERAVKRRFGDRPNK